MNKLIRRIATLLLCTSFLLPTTTYALGGSDAYVGFGAGQATLVRQSNPNETAVGYKLFGGLHATGPFYVEVSHVELGDYFTDTVSISGNALHVAGKLPFSASVYALAKVGLFSWDVQTVGGSSTTGSDTSYGFAVAWSMPVGYTARIEWENYSDVGQTTPTNGNDMTLLSVGIEMHF